MRPQPYDIFQAASDAMFLTDMGGVILECNASAERLYGFAQSDLAGKPFSSLLPKERRDEFAAISSEILQGKVIPPFMTERITSSNKIIIVSTAYSPVRDENGHITAILSVERILTEGEIAACDLSRWKQTEQQARALLQRINLVTSAIHLGIWEIDFKDRKIHWDENMCDLFDLPPGSSIDLDTWPSFIHPEDRSRIMEAYYKSIQNKASEVDFDFRIVTAKGVEKHLLSKMLIQPDETGASIKAIGATWDNTEQFKSRDALQESERKMQAVMRSTKERIYLLDKEGRIVLMNEEAKSVLNKFRGTQGEAGIIGNLLVDIAAPNIKHKVEESVQAALAGEQAEYEASVVIDGKEHWFVHTFLPARNEEDEIAGVAFISLDITKRKQAELKQQALLQRLNLITSAVKLGTFETDLTTGRMTGDENLYHIYELDARQPFTMEVFSKSLHPEDRERILTNIDHAVNSKWPEINQEFRIITTGGQEKYILNKTLYIGDESGNFIKAIGSNWDITELHKTREALLESGRRMNALLQSTREGIYLYDTNLRLILINEQGRRFAEMRSGKKPVLGSHVSEFTREDEIESVEKILQTVLAGKTYDRERNISLEDGSLWLHLTYNPVKENDTIIGVCLVARDVTELVHSREKLVTARQRAEESERLQEQFLANMSHEIRTPLNGIVGMSNLLLNTSLDGQQKEFLHSILHSSDSLLFLINDILDLSKIKAGKFRIEKIPMDVYEVVEELTPPFKAKAEEKGIRFSVMMDPGIPKTVSGDPHRLVQVLNNLLSNAVKFTQQGFIKLEVEVADRVADQMLLKFIVSDSGIGIEENNLQHVFESFAQEAGDTARKFGGTGLGLAITQRLAELQGGSVSVNSTKGEGSRFEVTIPYEVTNEKLEASKAKAAVQPVTNGKPDFTGKRVLVAEDNEVNQQVIRHLLKDYGIEVVLTPDGKQAVGLLEAGITFDLILLDLRMPVMDGFQALTAIRQRLKLSIPIIVLTASVLRDERDRCIEMGANDYQAKPFSRPVLLQCLQRFLG